jgi:hypothetical protein
MDAASNSYRDYAAAVSRLWGGAPRRRIEEAALYLTHVDGAHSLRAVSAASGKPLSTVHRAVRRMEALRDDPLIDSTLDAVGRHEHGEAPASREKSGAGGASLDTAEVRRCLEVLGQDGTFLMVAHGAGRAGVFSPENGLKKPVFLIDVARASEMVARGWLRLVSRTEMSVKYVIEQRVVGKTPLRRLMASRGRDLTAAQVAVPALARLARRSGTDGVPHVTSLGMAAARQLRRDHAMSTGGNAFGDLASVEGQALNDAGPRVLVDAARRRVAEALEAVGAGLSEPLYAVCCLDESIAAFERRMGWAPKTARVVLGIALERLATHYGLTRPKG